jgi:CBS domain-containing protein
MRCQDIMKKDVECVSPQDTVQAAAKRMRDQNVGFLPVCDESRKALGTITDRDLAIRVLAEGNQPNTSAQDVMTREVVACRPEDDLRQALELMSKHHKSRILCVDENGRLVGVISLSDIAQSSGGEAAQTLRQVSQREARA